MQEAFRCRPPDKPTPCPCSRRGARLTGGVVVLRADPELRPAWERWRYPRSAIQGEEESPNETETDQSEHDHPQYLREGNHERAHSARIIPLCGPRPLPDATMRVTLSPLCGLIVILLILALLALLLWMGLSGSIPF